MREGNGFSQFHLHVHLPTRSMHKKSITVGVAQACMQCYIVKIINTCITMISQKWGSPVLRSL